MSRTSHGFVAIVGVLGLVAAGCGGSTGSTTTTATPATPTTVTTLSPVTTLPPVTTQPPVTTSAPNAQATEDSDFQLVEDAIAAWNASDFDAFLAFFDEESTVFWRPAHAADVRDKFEFRMALGDLIVTDECETTSPGKVVCYATSSDDLSGPVGVVDDEDWVFRVSDDRVTAFAIVFDRRSRSHFWTLMGEWLEDARPEVWESTFAAPEECTVNTEISCEGGGTWYATPEAAAVLLDLASEFIAQSDEYSIDE